MLVKIHKFYVLTFFKAKKLLGADEKQLGVRERLMAGSMAGVASQTSIYPLEVTWLIYNFFATYEVMRNIIYQVGNTILTSQFVCVCVCWGGWELPYEKFVDVHQKIWI